MRNILFVKLKLNKSEMRNKWKEKYVDKVNILKVLRENFGFASRFLVTVLV